AARARRRRADSLRTPAYVHPRSRAVASRPQGHVPRRAARAGRRRARPADRRLLADGGSHRRRARRGGAHGGDSRGVRRAARPGRVGRGAPGLPAQGAHRAPRADGEPATGGRDLGLPQAVRERVRRLRRRPRRHLHLGGAGHRHGSGPARRALQGAGRDRRRLARLGARVRGAEQRRRLGARPRGGAQRQRDVDRAQRGRDAQVPHLDPAQPALQPAARQDRRHRRPRAGRALGRRHPRAAVGGERQGVPHARRAVRGAGVPLLRPDRRPRCGRARGDAGRGAGDEGAAARARDHAEGARLSRGRARREVARAPAGPRPGHRQAAARVHREPGLHRGVRPGARGARRREPEGRHHHGGDAGGHGHGGVRQGAPRPLLRRGDRRGTRGDLRRGAGHAGGAPGGGHLLHVLAARVRQRRARRGDPAAAGGVRDGPRRARGRGRRDAHGAVRHRLHAGRARDDGDRAQGRPRDAGAAPGRGQARRAVLASLPARRRARRGARHRGDRGRAPRHLGGAAQGGRGGRARGGDDGQPGARRGGDAGRRGAAGDGGELPLPQALRRAHPRGRGGRPPSAARGGRGHGGERVRGVHGHRRECARPGGARHGPRRSRPLRPPGVAGSAARDVRPRRRGHRRPRAGAARERGDRGV
ncbi:MAG: 1-deoxy-D-xylulose 5-phosphate synthase, partial [uncultured Gemmatimonadaceae bacterium]